MSAVLSPAILEALAIGGLPDVDWDNQDDLCDCTYQRIGMWKNPYLAETQEIRLCCIWAELGKQFPEHVRTMPGYWSPDRQEWLTAPREWDGETEMPRAIWYRHLARKLGRPLAEIRAEYQDKDGLRPKGARRTEPVPFVLLLGGQEIMFDLRRMRFADAGA